MGMRSLHSVLPSDIQRNPDGEGDRSQALPSTLPLRGGLRAHLPCRDIHRNPDDERTGYHPFPLMIPLCGDIRRNPDDDQGARYDAFPLMIPLRGRLRCRLSQKTPQRNRQQ